MVASFLAAFFFALNATCASRNVRELGPLRANLGRLIVAALVLGAFAHTLGNGFASASMLWFALSGIIGMGIGDLGVYAALPLLGSRLTVLLTQCLAAPLAACAEWAWLGTRLSAAQLAWGGLILVGVVVAITPGKSSPPRVRVRPIGFVFGFIAACGQGFGAVVSRKGVNVAEAAGEAAHNATFGLTAAYQRIFAGLIFVLIWFACLQLLTRVRAAKAARALRNGHHDGDAKDAVQTSGSSASSEVNPRRGWRRAGWLVANGLAGPVLGVGCYQWALATTPSGIVLPIAATAPLLAIPIAYWIEGDRPSRRGILGGLIAVAGCIALTRAR